MAINKSTYDVTRGDFPQVNRGEQRYFQPLFTEGSNPSDIISEGVKIKPGFGIIPAGTIMALTATDEYVPYVPTTYSDNVAVSPIIVDHAAETAIVYVSLDEVNKYNVGDVVVLANSDPDYLNGGAITAIVEEAGRAKITFTTASAAGADFTVAKSAHIYVKSGASGKFSDATYILMASVDTGYGSNALGAYAPVIVSHAKVWKHMVWNFDAAAKTAMGAAVAELPRTLVLR